TMDMAVVDYITEIFPDTTWYLWKYDGISNNCFWEDINLHREYLEWLRDQCNLNNPVDWYGICVSSLYKRSGNKILKIGYDNSLYWALLAAYPLGEWQPWKFQHIIDIE